MRVDTVIVGAGTAGLSALREVRRATDDFLIVNDGHWGTTCAASGCMPSKALIEAANTFHRRHVFDEMGLTGADAVGADIKAVLGHVRRLRDDFVKGPESVPAKLGKRAVSGRARVLGPDTLEVNGTEIRARAIVLAPGSRPIVPEAWRGFGDRILTTDTLFEQTDLPSRMAVVGMGPVGVELAQALARLGIEVAGFDASERLAGIDDPDVLEAFAPLIGAELELHLGAPAELENAAGGIRVSGAGDPFDADVVLAAMGRRPNVDDLGLETLGIALDDDGLPEIDPQTLRLGDLPIFLAGDANGDRAILHEAADEGYIAGCNAVSTIESYCRRTPLSIVFCTPQVARVGSPYSALAKDEIVSARAEFSKQGRARIAAESYGLVRVHADRRTGQLLGAEMCMPEAEHIAHLLALALEQELEVSDMLAMPFYHPVLEEGLRTALRRLLRQLPQSRRSDLSQCPQVGFDALD